MFTVATSCEEVFEMIGLSAFIYTLLCILGESETGLRICAGPESDSETGLRPSPLKTLP